MCFLSLSKRCTQNSFCEHPAMGRERDGNVWGRICIKLFSLDKYRSAALFLGMFACVFYSCGFRNERDTMDLAIAQIFRRIKKKRSPGLNLESDPTELLNSAI